MVLILLCSFLLNLLSLNPGVCLWFIVNFGNLLINFTIIYANEECELGNHVDIRCLEISSAKRVHWLPLITEGTPQRFKFKRKVAYVFLFAYSFLSSQSRSRTIFMHNIMSYGFLNKKKWRRKKLKFRFFYCNFLKTQKVLSKCYTWFFCLTLLLDFGSDFP